MDKANIPLTRALPSSAIRRQRIYQRPFLRILNNQNICINNAFYGDMNLIWNHRQTFPLLKIITSYNPKPKTNHLKGFDDCTMGEVKSHVTGKVEALSQINAARHVQKRSLANVFGVSYPINGGVEGIGVQGGAVTDSAKVRNRQHLAPVLRRNYTGASDGISEGEMVVSGEQKEYENIDRKSRDSHCCGLVLTNETVKPRLVCRE